MKYLATYPQTKVPSRVVHEADMETFQREEPYGYHLEPLHRSIAVAGRTYVLAGDCPDDGYPPWMPGATPEEEAEEQRILAMPADLRERYHPAFKTRAQRIAQKAIDDEAMRLRIAEAAAREQAEAEAKAAERQAEIDAAVNARLAAIEAAKG